MDEKYTIALRDRTPGEEKTLIDIDYEGYMPEKMLTQFLKEARSCSASSLDGRQLDVYIGVWASQACFSLTDAFVAFCGQHSIPIEVDFNS